MRSIAWRIASFRFAAHCSACSALSLMICVVPVSMGFAAARDVNSSAERSADLWVNNSLTTGRMDLIANAVGNDDALDAMAAASVVYLGETHDEPADHAAQLEIIEALSAQNDIAIALEMFQRPFQPVLDAYLAGNITEAALISQSEYETRWGFDWDFYAPILRYAKNNQIPLIALNTPAEITRKVASEGLESLNGQDFQFVPPIDEIDLSNQAYREQLQAVFDAHGASGNSDGFENFFAAQVLWDETMAEGVARQRLAEPNRQVVVLVGEGHIGYDRGIPDRVARRLPEIAQVSVQFLGADESSKPGFTDLFWRL